MHPLPLLLRVRGMSDLLRGTVSLLHWQRTKWQKISAPEHRLKQTAGIRVKKERMLIRYRRGVLLRCRYTLYLHWLLWSLGQCGVKWRHWKSIRPLETEQPLGRAQTHPVRPHTTGQPMSLPYLEVWHCCTLNSYQKWQKSSLNAASNLCSPPPSACL